MFGAHKHGELGRIAAARGHRKDWPDERGSSCVRFGLRLHVLGNDVPFWSTLASTSTNRPWVSALSPDTPSNFVLFVTFIWKVRVLLTRIVKLPVKFELLVVVVTDSTMPFRSSISPKLLTDVITVGVTRMEGLTWPVIWPVESTWIDWNSRKSSVSPLDPLADTCNAGLILAVTVVCVSVALIVVGTGGLPSKTTSEAFGMKVKVT